MTSRNNNLHEGSLLPSKEKSKEVFLNSDAVCFDVDSTVICDEGIDQLAVYCGKQKEVIKITEQAMKGGLEFRDALRLRLNLICPSLDTVRNFIKEHQPNLTKDVETLVRLLHQRNVDVYLVSGGFRSLIAPVAKLLQIPLENIWANRLKFYFDVPIDLAKLAVFFSKRGPVPPMHRPGGRDDSKHHFYLWKGYPPTIPIRILWRL